jgi:hypothetical protein
MSQLATPLVPSLLCKFHTHIIAFRHVDSMSPCIRTQQHQTLVQFNSTIECFVSFCNRICRADVLAELAWRLCIWGSASCMRSCAHTADVVSWFRPQECCYLLADACLVELARRSYADEPEVLM